MADTAALGGPGGPPAAWGAGGPRVRM